MLITCDDPACASSSEDILNYIMTTGCSAYYTFDWQGKASSSWDDVHRGLFQLAQAQGRDLQITFLMGDVFDHPPVPDVRQADYKVFMFYVVKTVDGGVKTMREVMGGE